MNFDRNKKYFEQHISSATIVVSAICIGLGAVMIVLLANTAGLPGWLMTTLGFIFLATGLVIFLWRSAVKIPDNEIDAQVSKLSEQFLADFKERFVVIDIRRMKYDIAHNIAHQQFEPVTFATYCFDDARSMHKIGNDGKSRSSVYSLSGFMLKPSTVCLAEREVSLINSDSPIPDLFTEIPYTSLSHASLEDINTDGGYVGITAYKHLRLTDNDGKTVIEFPILADAAADSYVTEFNQRVRRAKEKATAGANE